MRLCGAAMQCQLPFSGPLWGYGRLYSRPEEGQRRPIDI